MGRSSSFCRRTDVAGPIDSCDAAVGAYDEAVYVSLESRGRNQCDVIERTQNDGWHWLAQSTVRGKLVELPAKQG